ncbi:MAG TPA: hypothetical protein VJL32_01505 [Candidatus Paceibacterota bacterium]
MSEWWIEIVWSAGRGGTKAYFIGFKADGPARARREALRILKQQARMSRFRSFLRLGEIRSKNQLCAWLHNTAGVPVSELLAARRPEKIFDYVEEVGL